MPATEKAPIAPALPSPREHRASLAENILWSAIFVLVTGYGLILLRGGYAHNEGQFFLSGYLDGRGLFEKVFSSHFDNWDCYSPRELGYFFGMLDARAIVLGSRLGFPFLYSVTSVTSILVAAVLLWRLIPRIAPRLSMTHAGLIVSLMLATPPLELSSYYYRPAKALVAVFLVMVSWQVFRLTAGAKERSPVVDSALLFVCATLMGWSDPQGVFFIVVAIVAVAGVSVTRTRSVNLAFSALFSALAVNLIWKTAIGPRISRIADGFMPDTLYERVAPRFTFATPHNYSSALSLWLGDFGYFFGGWGAVGGALCLILIGVAYWARPTPMWETGVSYRHRPFFVLFVIAGMMLAMYTAMYAKLPSIVWPESRLVYYWIPGMVVVAIVAAGACDSAFAISNRFRTPIALVLGVMTCTSLLSLERQDRVVRHGGEHDWIEESGRERNCMRGAETAIAGYDLSPEGALACLSVRLAAFGSAGPGQSIKPAVPNPYFYCKRAQHHVPMEYHPAFRSLGP